MARPLVIRFGALGDMVLLTPLLRALAERHGAPCDVVGIGGWVPVLFRHLPFVGEIVSVRSRNGPYWLNPDQWRLVRWLRAHDTAALYLLQTDAKSERLVRRSGTPITASARLTPHRPGEHVVEHYARLAGTPPGGTTLAISADEAAECRTWLNFQQLDGPPLVLVQPGNKRTMKGTAIDDDRKHWPDDRWVSAIRGVLDERPDAHVLIIGAPSETWTTEPIAAACADARVRSVAHDLPLRRLFALLARAHSLISVDTGPAHAAAAVACPTTVLFSRADPRRIRPWSDRSPVTVVYGPPGAPEPDDEPAWAAQHSMDGISVDAVLAAWRSLTGQVRA